MDKNFKKTKFVCELKLWREKNKLSKNVAVDVFLAAGLPIIRSTYQSWETPKGVPPQWAIYILGKFMAENPRVFPPPRKRKKALVTAPQAELPLIFSSSPGRSPQEELELGR